MTSLGKTNFHIQSEVRQALEQGKPVVALESTVITHGLPYPENIRLASDLEMEIREEGCTPATIAIIDGMILIGLDSTQHGADGAIRLAKEILNEHPDHYFQPDQNNNPSNPRAHELTTGPEIIAATNGDITHFVACVGTGGTIMGTGRALRTFRRDIKVVSVHPDDAMHGIEGTKYLEEGAIMPGIFDKAFPDDRLTVGTEAAFDMTKRIAREEGLFVGTSSGAALAAALKVAEKLDHGTIVVMFPDGGDRYLSREI